VRDRPKKKGPLEATNPAVIDAATAMALLPENRRRLYERFRLDKFLRMQLKQGMIG
jgi:hypothetical protein